MWLESVGLLDPRLLFICKVWSKCWPGFRSQDIGILLSKSQAKYFAMRYKFLAFPRILSGLLYQHSVLRVGRSWTDGRCLLMILDSGSLILALDDFSSLLKTKRPQRWSFDCWYYYENISRSIPKLAFISVVKEQIIFKFLDPADIVYWVLQGGFVQNVSFRIFGKVRNFIEMEWTWFWYNIFVRHRA